MLQDVSIICLPNFCPGPRLVFLLSHLIVCPQSQGWHSDATTVGRRLMFEQKQKKKYMELIMTGLLWVDNGLTLNSGFAWMVW